MVLIFFDLPLLLETEAQVLISDVPGHGLHPVQGLLVLHPQLVEDSRLQQLLQPSLSGDPLLWSDEQIDLGEGGAPQQLLHQNFAHEPGGAGDEDGLAMIELLDWRASVSGCLDHRSNHLNAHFNNLGSLASGYQSDEASLRLLRMVRMTGKVLSMCTTANVARPQ